MKTMLVVNWCGHGQEFVPWPEADGYWVLVPVVEAVATSALSVKPLSSASPSE